MPKCPECNTMYGTDDLFCSKCGFQLKEKKEKELHKEIAKGMIYKETKDKSKKGLFLWLTIFSIILAFTIHVFVGIIVFAIGSVYINRWYHG